MPTFVCMCVRVHFVCVCTRACMCVCVCVCVSLSVCLSVSGFVRECAFMCTCVRVYVSSCLCLWASVCVYIAPLPPKKGQKHATTYKNYSKAHMKLKCKALMKKKKPMYFFICPGQAASRILRSKPQATTAVSITMDNIALQLFGLGPQSQWPFN